MAGVDSTGYVQKTLSEIITSISNGYRTVYGISVNVAARARIGQRIALFSNALSEVWELGEAIYNAMDPDAATGAGLVNQLKLIGIAQKGATFSKVTLTLVGTATTAVAAGKRAAVPNTTTRFALDALATIAAVAAWATGTLYAAGVRRRANGNVYQCVTGGTSAAAGTGPNGTGQAINDNGVIWRYLGTGDGAIDAAATATVSGPVQGFAGTVNTIDTPVSGWANVVNLEDAETGQALETDPEMRARRNLSFAKSATTPLEAVIAEVLEVDGVTSCAVFENTTMATVDGVPPKAFETLVEGGDDQEIRDAILRSRPGGIEAYGNTSGTALDSAGGAHTIKFSRPVDVDVWVTIALSYNRTLWPADGQDQVAEALATREDARAVGLDVVASRISGGVMFGVPGTPDVGTPGIIDVSSVLIGTANPPVSSATIAITPRQKARYDTSRIVVNATEGSL